MTEAEWQKIAVQLARGIMGWRTWNDFSIARQERIKRGYAIPPMRNWPGAIHIWWEPIGELYARQTMSRTWWCPYTNREQAMMLFKKVGKRVHHCVIEQYLTGYNVIIGGWLTPVDSWHQELPKAICKACFIAILEGVLSA